MKVVFDLDGTLSDATKRGQKYLIDPPKKNWTGFNQAAKYDPPIEPTVQILKDMIRTGHHVEIWTGRGAEVHEETVKWLIDNLGYDMSRSLKMRPIGDHRHDATIKKEWAEQFEKPDVVFEDRQRVVNMWRSIGVICYQVAPGDF